MSQFFYIHPDNPQPRLINQAVEMIKKGGVIVYPTDSGYALGCKLEDKAAMERICRIRQLADGHNFTLMCRDLSELSTYAFVDNVAFRLIKNNTPGNYTFVLQGTKEVPRRLLQEKRKTIGLRVPSNPIALASYARQFNLQASQGSDFHQPCAWIELGRKLWLPADVIPVWQNWAASHR